MNFNLDVVKQIDSKCLILDIESINPIEIIVITRKPRRVKKNIKKLFSESKGNLIDNKSVCVLPRNILFLTHVSSLLNKCVDDFGNEIKKWPEDVRRFALIYYYLFSSKNLVKKLIADTLDVDKSDDLQLNMQLDTYLRKLGSRIDTKKVQRERLFERVEHRMVLEEISFVVRAHNLLTRRKYYSFVHEHFKFEPNQYYDISKKSGTDCILIKQITENGAVFIKGNAPRICNLDNEINAQNRICSFFPNNDIFVKMNEYGADKQWISYSFVDGLTLKELCKTDSLDSVMLEKLGVFLLEVLSKLKQIRVSHCDIRPENIMVCDKKCESGFVLIDFGGAAIDEKLQWKKNTRINNYYKRTIGGYCRYNDRIIDDAASALLTYLECGGDIHDSVSKELLKKVGTYSLCV